VPKPPPRPPAAALPAALLTVDEVAGRLRASPRHVRRLIERGELPVVRLGKLVRVTPDDLGRLVAASRQG
jgi:excisionase family DNA binding protein